MRIPFSKYVIRPAVDWMTVVISTRVERDLLQLLEVKRCLSENPFRRVGEDRQRSIYQVLVPAGCGPSSAEVQRYGTHALVGVRFRVPSRFKDGNWTKPDEIVHMLKCPRNHT